ncbi:MAG: hypothetical protein RL033_2217 [Pseudomonadota bacterium]
MKNWKAKVWLTALALLSPCIVSGEPPAVSAAEEPPPAVGSVTLQWTLSGRREALDCGGLGIDRFQVSLTAAGATDAEPWTAPCDAFQISIDLAPGTYTGEAVMVDRLDRPVTMNVPVEQLDVVAGRDIAKSVDFPMAAFLNAGDLLL